jgi:hypothetical protein
MKSGLWGVVLICCLVPESSAYVYDVRIAKRLVPGGGYQHLIGFSDFHDRNQVAVAAQQRTLFEQLVKNSDPSAMKFLVEDLSSPNTEGAYSCARYHANTRGGFLGGITDILRHNGCAVDNLEFRYCRVVALGLVAAGTHSDQAQKMQEIVSLQQFVQETAAMADKVARYTDSGMQPFFHQWRASLEPKFSELKRRAQTGISVREYLKKFEIANALYEKEINSLLAYDSALLDVSLVHEVLNDTRHKVLVVVAGGTHIRNVFDALEKKGYVKVPVVQENLLVHGGSSTTIDARATKTKGITPRPVSLLSSKVFWPKK